MSPKSWGPIKQIAYVVEDLDASIRRWIGFAGIGPWQVYRNTLMRGHYRGQPTAVKMHVGLSYQDGVQIELIQPIDAAPSPYRDDAGRPRVGLNHIAWHSHALDRDVAQARERGYVPVFEASNGAVRVAYLEAPEEPGVLMEFIEAVPAVLEGFADGMRAARDWDGASAPMSVIDFES